MAAIATYRVLETLHRDERSLVQRAIRDDDGAAVILKTPVIGRADASAGRRYRHAFALLRDLSLPGVPAALALERHDGRPRLVTEDIGAAALRGVLDDGPVDVPTALHIAIGVAEILAALHARHIILLDALGPHAGVIAEVLPDLALVLGPTPPAAPLPPADARNRFNLALRRFVRALADEATPGGDLHR